MRSAVIGLVAVSLVYLSAASATLALAGATPEQKCQAAKHAAAGKYGACRQNAEKSLASAGDVTKYGVAIAKCETKFADAWQKAIDVAEQAGVACLDAPLPASDYKTVIDATSANIATALAGGGLTLPSTCGNGTLEAGEGCDFETVLASCSAATEGGQPFGHVTCGAGCATNTSACQSCAGVGGRNVLGACWFLGSLGGSCSGACSARGLVYDPATATGANHDNCGALQMAWAGNHPANQLVGGGNEGTGCNFFNVGGTVAVYRTADEFSPTTADATTSNLYRVCACLQP